MNRLKWVCRDCIQLLHLIYRLKIGMPELRTGFAFKVPIKGDCEQGLFMFFVTEVLSGWLSYFCLQLKRFFRHSHFGHNAAWRIRI